MTVSGMSEQPDPVSGERGNVAGSGWDDTHGGDATPHGEARQKRITPEAAIALAIIVMMNAPKYRHCFLAELEWLLFPAILANQYKLYLKKTRPVGFAAWAKVSPEVAARLDGGDSRLKPEEWRCGELVRLIHVIAPFGGAKEIVADLEESSNVRSHSK